NTTGLIVFTSHRDHSLRIQRQFERGEAEKTYLCRVNGQPTEETFRCDLPISRDTAEAGARCIDEENGLSASTEFRVLKRLDDGTALVEAKPLTGRTNQIRVHLWHLGFPILNDSVYLPEQKIGEKITHDVSAQPMCLHSWKLRLREPETGEGLNFETPLPAWGTDAAEFSDVPRLEPTK
ncbi:RluA family pseudouridine synthase, partial [bacterium]|nr:RluA family pseudouridine synthase [bacterium]